MAIHVKSEIGKLKKVMLHRPGQELEHLVPEDLERLLFDDIPYLKTAKIEHDMFAEIMQGQGVEVVYLEDLTAEVLKNPEKKEQFVREFIAEGGASATKVREQLYEYLMNIADEKELVLKTMSGIRASELNVKMSCPLVSLVKKESQFLLDPIPNLYFTRDPFACIGNGVSLNHMYSRTRRRETLYGKYILKYHPDFAGKVPFYYDRAMDFAIEGGDILNLSNKVIAIGISQRTTPEAIEILAQNIFADENGKIGLSDDAYHFIAGIMKHARGMSAITNPLVNSYKRLVPGYEAPVYIAWSAKNRSPLIRIPASRGNGTRVELRNPDPTANPYLVLALCLAAGLDGIKNKIEVPESVDCNIYEMTPGERRAAGIENMPADLKEAVDCLVADEFLCSVLGEHITTKYVEAKMKEWENYTTRVSQWEIDEYLYKY